MSKVVWYADRLRSMSPREVGWRVGRVARGRIPGGWSTRGTRAFAPTGGWSAGYAQFRHGADRPLLLDRTKASDIAAAQPELADALISAARAAAGHRFSYFGYPEVSLPRPIDWNYDPLADVRWPDLPAARIDHRTAPGDVKWIWELNRLQHLPWLAQAWLITGDDAFSGAAFDELDSWIIQNPAGQGIAWRGAFEAGVRAISVAVALQGLRDSPALTPERYRSVLSMVAESARRCWAERSLYSSANNHLIGELSGLATVAILFPELPGARRWERRALAGLTAQADRQILPDGAGAEQAVGYQIFTAELLLVVAHLLWLRDGTAPAALTDAVLRSARYLSAIVGDGDPAPRYGDDDEGFALRLGPEPVRTLREHLRIVGAFSGDSELVVRGTPSLSAGWFRRPGTLVSAPPATSDPPGNLYAREGGLVVLRAGTRRVTMDVGPLGFLAIAAHGHADALAVTLSKEGVDLVGDPGAGSYYGNPDLRRVHRGTRAHATVVVDGADQSVIGGPFLWRQHARVRVRAVDLVAGVVDAEHDGYTRFDMPVRHRRWLIAPPDASTVLVVDLLTGRGEHQATVSWPLAPGLRVSESAGSFAATHVTGARLQMSYAATVAVSGDQVRGDEHSQQGWWTDRLERPVPAALLGMHASGLLPIAFATLLRPGDDDEESVVAVNVTMSSNTIEVTWRSGGVDRALSLDLVGDAVLSTCADLT